MQYKNNHGMARIDRYFLPKIHGMARIDIFPYIKFKCECHGNLNMFKATHDKNTRTHSFTGMSFQYMYKS